MQWAASQGVVPLTTYPYTPRTGDCQGAFDSRKVVFAGAQVVDLSKPDAILQVLCLGRLCPALHPSSQSGIRMASAWHPHCMCWLDRSPTHARAAACPLPLRVHCPLQALGKGPLAITIWGDSNTDIQLYSTGIYTPPASASAHEDHAVTLVGYGTETLASGAEADYWIIKNRQGLLAG